MKNNDRSPFVECLLGGVIIGAVTSIVAFLFTDYYKDAEPAAVRVKIVDTKCETQP